MFGSTRPIIIIWLALPFPLLRSPTAKTPVTETMIRQARISEFARQPARWSAAKLEPRLMLAGDVGSEVAEVAVGGEIAAVTEEVSTRTIVFIDQTLDQADMLRHAVRPDSEIVMLDPQEDAITQITQHLQTNSGINRVSIVSHGDAGELVIAGQRINTSELEQRAEEIKQWRSSLSDQADVLLFGCHVARGESGRDFIQRLARLTGADVAASIDRTGNATQGADWELEYQVGSVKSPNLFCEVELRKFTQVLDVVVHAWGQTGDEQIAVLIGDESAGVFSLSQSYEAFHVSADAGVTADQVRIQFINDEYRPEDDYDRNVTIESIQVGGVFYETEDVSVLSTGTWRPQDGVRTGFGRGEVLHANGEFRFGNDLDQGGSRLEIVAKGSTGNERFSLILEGQSIGDFDVATENKIFVYETQSPISADDVRIEFLNDLYEPGVIDHNLIVDRISVDGIVTETESDGVFSTGTWKAEDGVTPGFRNNEYLHASGYFQFGNNGSFETQFLIDTSFGEDGVVQFGESSDGSLPAVDGGFFRTEGGLIRKYDSEFNMDLSFGDGGGAALPNSESLSITAIDQLSDGSLVALSLSRLTLDNLSLHRLSPTGDYYGAIVVNDLGAGPITRFGSGPKIEVTSQDQIILGGGKENTDVAVFLSLNDDLTLDAGFGSGGIVEVTGVIRDFDSVTEIVATGDGGFFTYGPLEGSSQLNGRVIHKITAGGVLDSSFGNGGISEAVPFVNFGSILGNLKIDSQGRAVARTGDQFVRWTVDGALDATFGDGGIATLVLDPVPTVGDATETLRSGAFVLDNQDRLVINRGVGVSRPSAPPLELGVLFGRLNEDGTSDTTLGAEFIDSDTNQAVNANIVNGEMFVDDQGRILVSGFLAGNSFARDPAVGRYLIV